MKPFIINGKKGAIKQPGSYGKGQEGYYSVIPFEGTDQEVRNRAAQYDAVGAYYDVEQLHGGRARLTVRLAWANTNQLGQEIPIESWELDPQEVEKDLLDADFPNGLIGVLSKNDREILGSLIENPSSDYFGGGDIEVDVGGKARFIDNPTRFYSWYLLLKAGVRSFPIPAHVVRRTYCVSTHYSVKAAQTNCGRLLSTASFIALEGVPNTLLFDLPTHPDPSQYIEVAEDLVYSWRKCWPAVSDLALQRRSIVQTWQFGLWAKGIYGTVL